MDGIYGEAKSTLLPEPKVYRSLVGGLMYTLITRPDVVTAVSMCARYLALPRQAHLEATKRVLRYLYHTHTLYPWYTTNTVLTTYASQSLRIPRGQMTSTHAEVDMAMQCTLAKR